MPKKLIISDIDGTLVSEHKPSLSIKLGLRLKNFIKKHPHIGIVYATGRDLDLALYVISRFCMPKPLCLICDVGTSIYSPIADKWKIDQKYRDMMASHWPGKVKICKTLSKLPMMEQEPEKQKEFKQSYYFDFYKDDAQIKRDVYALLEKEGLSCNIVASKDMQKRCGLLDVLPYGMTKTNAILYARQKLGVSMSNSLFAGDSGNDFDALVSGMPAVIVNNASDSVKEEVRKATIRRNIEKKVFFSKKDFADGVLEGASYFGFF